MAEKILIVDDDKSICEILEFNLKNEGFDIDTAYSAEEALKKLSNQYTLILLDVMMSGMSGYKMAEKLRTEGNHTPIIFLTAKDTENDMLTGFSVGGDDYISKPFSIKEVIARIKAVIKRLENNNIKNNTNRKLIFDDFVIDLEAKQLTIKGEKISLTKTEFEILTFLAENNDRVFSREEIIDSVWDKSTFITTRTVDVHITRLRKKLDSYATFVINRPGYGYKFNHSNV